MTLQARLEQLERLTFGDVLKREREAQGLSHHDVSCRVGVSKALVRAWEKGVNFPNRFEMKKLIGSMRSLSHYIHLLPQETVAAVVNDFRTAEEEFPKQLAAIVRDEPPPKTFGEALRRVRLSEGFGQDEVGELVGVTGQAVSAWESGNSNPVKDHYDKLVRLFSDLCVAPKPDTRDIDKPDGGAGKEKPRTIPEPQETSVNKPLNRFAPPAPASERAPDLKMALIQWGRLVHALKSHPDVHLLTDFLAEANRAGMTLPEAMAALADPT